MPLFVHLFISNLSETPISACILERVWNWHVLRADEESQRIKKSAVRMRLAVLDQLSLPLWKKKQDVYTYTVTWCFIMDSQSAVSPAAPRRPCLAHILPRCSVADIWHMTNELTPTPFFCFHRCFEDVVKMEMSEQNTFLNHFSTDKTWSTKQQLLVSARPCFIV